MNFLATTTFGLEAILRKELKSLGLWYEAVGDGYVEFSGEEMAMSISNVWLRTANRVFLELASFSAETFDELFEGVFALPWADFLTEESTFPVLVKSYKSQLSSTPACQAIVKKAIVKKLQGKYPIDVFVENGASVEVHVWIRNNQVKVLLNTSGEGLHKRGYRANTGEAPIKETLAAGLVYLSEWNGETGLYDPFCGSGTILIEAAMLACNIAPGLQRSFAFEQWSWPDQSIPTTVRDEARKKQVEKTLNIHGSDIDQSVLELAKEAADRVGIKGIQFSQQSIFSHPALSDVTILSNPPYGVRMGSDEVDDMYRQLGSYFRTWKKCSWHIFTAFPYLEEAFGKNAKRRKLYNGGIQCYLYSYLL